MRKELLAIGLASMIALCAAGCGNGSDTLIKSESSNGHIAFKDIEKISGDMFTNIPGNKNLYYDTTTKIVYIIINEAYAQRGYGYMSPYYSEHGRLCRYIDGQIKEVSYMPDLPGFKP